MTYETEERRELDGLAEMSVVGRSRTHGLLLGQITRGAKDYNDGVLLELHGAETGASQPITLQKPSRARPVLLSSCSSGEAWMFTEAPPQHQHHDGSCGKISEGVSSAQDNAPRQTYPALASTSG